MYLTQIYDSIPIRIISKLVNIPGGRLETPGSSIEEQVEDPCVQKTGQTDTNGKTKRSNWRRIVVYIGAISLRADRDAFRTMRESSASKLTSTSTAAVG